MIFFYIIQIRLFTWEHFFRNKTIIMTRVSVSQYQSEWRKYTSIPSTKNPHCTAQTHQYLVGFITFTWYILCNTISDFILVVRAYLKILHSFFCNFREKKQGTMWHYLCAVRCIELIIVFIYDFNRKCFLRQKFNWFNVFFFLRTKTLLKTHLWCNWMAKQLSCLFVSD
jgi:hypothetical protein